MVLCLKARESRSLPGLPGAHVEASYLKFSEPSFTMTASAVTYSAAFTRGRLRIENKVCRGMEQPGSSSGS
jgi:hypothetical protein